MSVASLQSLRGSSGSLPAFDLVVGFEPPSIPQGFVWKAVSERGEQPRQRPFNPSGVRLEVSAVAVDLAHHVPSIPQGFVWKIVGCFYRAAEHHPSIPQGFVWKEEALCEKRGEAVLQSLRGSSGRRESTPHGDAVRSFNPSGVRLEGLSDRRLAVKVESFNPSGVRLEGRRRAATPTRLRSFNPSGVRLEAAVTVNGLVVVRPSIPQGFVWKLRGGSRARRRVSPSIPQGFVWKDLAPNDEQQAQHLQSLRGSSGSRPGCCRRRRPASFNPSGVRLEAIRMPSGSDSAEGLQSLRGSSGRSVSAPSDRGRGPPSIPQGFVWKQSDISIQSITPVLQSLRGSSGRRLSPTSIR